MKIRAGGCRESGGLLSLIGGPTRVAELAELGMAEVEVGLELGAVAREMAADGVGEVAASAAELGAAAEKSAQ